MAQGNLTFLISLLSYAVDRHIYEAVNISFA